MEIGELIQAARERRGWTRSDLAAHAGISPASVTRIETGERTGNAETIARIARALNIPGDDIILSLLGQERETPLDDQFTMLQADSPLVRQLLRRDEELIQRIEQLEQRAHGEKPTIRAREIDASVRRLVSVSQAAALIVA